MLATRQHAGSSLLVRRFRGESGAGTRLVRVVYGCVPLAGGSLVPEYRRRLDGGAAQHLEGVSINVSARAPVASELAPSRVVQVAQWSGPRAKVTVPKSSPGGRLASPVGRFRGVPDLLLLQKYYYFFFMVLFFGGERG